MIEATRLAPHAALRHTLNAHARSPWHLPRVARASTLSAIHRGIHRGHGAGESGRRDSGERNSGGRDFGGRDFGGRDFGGRDFGGSGRRGSNERPGRRNFSPEEVRRAIVDGDFESPPPGKQSRRKRFHDPASSFGKTSMVYRMKFGDLKDKAEDILARNRDEQEGYRNVGGRRRGATPPQPDFRARMRGDEPEPENFRTREDTAFETRQDFDVILEKDRGTKRPKSLGPVSVKRSSAASQFLFGASVVNAALTLRRRKLYHLYLMNTGKRALQDPSDESGAKLRGLIKEARVQRSLVKNQNMAMMEKMSGGRPHNGCILEASPLPQLPIKALGPLHEDGPEPAMEVVIGRQSKEEEAVNGTDPLVTYTPNRKQKPLIVFLHHIVDPGNLGAMIRSAVILGASAVAITARGSATITPVAAKAASGATEEIPIFTVEQPNKFIAESQKAGWRFYAAGPASGRKTTEKLTIGQLVNQNPLAEAPCVLILGSEGNGLPRDLRKASNYEVTIPSASRLTVESLNVSVAGGILCNALLNPYTNEPAEEEPAEEEYDEEEAEEEAEEVESTEEGGKEKEENLF